MGGSVLLKKISKFWKHNVYGFGTCDTDQDNHNIPKANKPCRSPSTYRNAGRKSVPPKPFLLNPPAGGLPLRRQFPAALLIKRKDLIQDTCAVISIPNFCNICYNELTRREIWQMIRKGTMALLNPASLLFGEV